MKVWTILMLVLGLVEAPSYAAKRNNPTFPATEDSPSEEVISSAPGYRGMPAPQRPEQQDVQLESLSAEPVRAAPSPVRVPSPKQRVAISKKTKTSKKKTVVVSYDKVPTSQSKPFVDRLHLVETLVSKYGRAYDYRSMTVPELEAVLEKLDAEAAPTRIVRETESASPTAPLAPPVVTRPIVETVVTPITEPDQTATSTETDRVQKRIRARNELRKQVEAEDAAEASSEMDNSETTLPPVELPAPPPPAPRAAVEEALPSPEESSTSIGSQAPETIAPYDRRQGQ